MKSSRAASVVIGLTGNSGSGKSEVSRILVRQGAYLIDADKISHDILRLTPKGAAYDEVKELFGNEILLPDGEISRKKVSEIVFTDGEMLKRHTEITHKYIREQMLNELKEAKMRNERYIVMDAPLLVEAGLHTLCDSVWLVYADTKTRLDRVVNRDLISESVAIGRFNAQTPYEELKQYADTVIENHGSIAELEEAVICFLSYL